MSETETIDASLIRETQNQTDGIAKAHLTFNRLSIIDMADGNTTLMVWIGKQEASFVLTPDQCQHLADLLLKKA